ncbi:MAG: RNA polymerase sigma factor [Deltaproteobacteria bacterium]|nr:RNA polymerase sigma factor [Deltaproteobacteria bacterium]
MLGLIMALLLGATRVLRSPGDGGGEPSDEDLFARYVDGDRAAFGVLWSRHAPAIARLMRKQIRRSEDVNDLVQQTFLQLHRARRDFRQGARLRPWLYTIALNLRREYWRRYARTPIAHVELDERMLPTTEQADIVGKEDARRVRAALAKLPAGQRDVIELHWLEGFSFPEVAQIVGASLSAVKVRAHRGYKVLRKHLGPEEGPV